MSKNESVLCINKNELHNKYFIEDWEFSMIPRSICETDETTAQIIPYIVIKEADTGKYLTYQRGNGSTEARLISKFSMGFGGHISENVEDDIMLSIATGAYRELTEELGLTTPELLDTIINKIKLGDHVVISLFDSPNQVERVHLGLAFVIEVKKEEITAYEKGTINNPIWITEQELKSLTVNAVSSTFEPWSVHFVNSYYN